MGTPTALRKERSVLTGTSFADNTTGAITAQMVRQFTESGMGGYATIYSPTGTPASQVVSIIPEIDTMLSKVAATL